MGRDPPYALVERLSIKEIARRSGLSRNTVRKALRSSEPPRYRRPRGSSMLDPFEDEIRRLLREDPRLPGRRVRELIAEQGYAGGKTILDDYLRELRPLYLPRSRTFQRTSYRPGALCQFDLWEPSSEVAVGHGQTRRGYVVVCCLPYSRVGAGHARLLQGSARPAARDRILPAQARCAAGDARVGPGRSAARRRGQADRAVRRLLRPARARLALPGAARPESKGAVERLQGFIETSFEPGRRFLNEHHFQDELDRWFDERANVRFHRTLRCRPVDRLPEELQVMRPLPESTARRRPPLRHPRCARSVPARRHERLLARPDPRGQTRRGEDLPA